MFNGSKYQSVYCWIFCMILLAMISMTGMSQDDNNTSDDITELETYEGRLTYIQGVNNQGEMVGFFAHESGANHALYWDKEKIVDLNSLLPDNSKWELLEAYDINDNGLIVGLGIYNGEMRSFQINIHRLLQGNVEPTPTRESPLPITPTPQPTLRPVETPIAIATPTDKPVLVIPDNGVIVTESSASNTDLSGSTYTDTRETPELTIQWKLNTVHEIKEIHVYLQRPTDARPVFLGRQPDGTATSFVWKKGTALLNKQFSEGPVTGSYKFTIFPLTVSGQPRVAGPYSSNDFVEYTVSTGTVEQTPTPTVTPRPDTGKQSELTMPIQNVPMQFKRRAAQVLADLMGSGQIAPGWDDANLEPEVGLYFRPDVNGIAYFEFRVNPVGYIIVSSGPHDMPVTTYNVEDEESMSERLIRLAVKAGKVPVRLYKMDTFAYIAETAEGEIAAEYGNIPNKIKGVDPSWAQQESFEITEVKVEPSQRVDKDTDNGSTEFKRTVTGPEQSTIVIEEWVSWQEFKKNYLDSYGVFINAARREKGKEWDVEKSIVESGLGLLPKQSYRIALMTSEAKYDLSGPASQFVAIEVLKGNSKFPIITVTPQELPASGATDFSVSISYPDGSSETLKFFIVDEAIVQDDPNADEIPFDKQPGVSTSSVAPKGWGSWSSWTTYWAGNSGDQRNYDQISGSSCYSGCGPTAWAMLFGWADHQAWEGNSYWSARWGLYRSNGGTGSDADAPSTQDSGIENITWEINGYVDTFCISGSGATYPWKMDEAADYFSGRTGTSMVTHYNSVGISESRLREYARDQIKDHDTPAVIGTGWLEHYPMAWGYKWRVRYYKVLGVTISTDYDREFYLNNGWGGSGNGWEDASTWFAGEINP